MLLLLLLMTMLQTLMPLLLVTMMMMMSSSSLLALDSANRPIQDVATQLDRASTAASEMTSGSRSRRDGRVRNASSRPAKFILFPEEVSFIRHFPQANRNTHTEWGFYDPRGLDKVCYVGKRCLPYQCSGTETASAGRNGVPVASAGDKAYRAVEYSAGFHLLGSTRAPPRFSAGAKHAADTFIPLQPPPSVPRYVRTETPQHSLEQTVGLGSNTPYHKKAQEMQRALEMMEVQALDEWEPPSRASHPRLDGDHD
ncbi:unnamed protein product [Lampetra fluviatilis]